VAEAEPLRAKALAKAQAIDLVEWETFMF